MGLRSIAEAVTTHGPGHVDGFVGHLIEAGFARVGNFQGAEGWKALDDGRVVYVDYWGRAWALPRGTEKSEKELLEQFRREGGVSLSDTLQAAESARPGEFS